jgi:2-iminobutanoate/2-iminopropanoate deaminase
MQTLFVEDAPEAIGPSCHAVRSGPFYFLSGQTPLDADTMTIVGDTIEEQTGRVLFNISTVLNGLGLGLVDVVKTTVYLKSMDDFAGMNEVYGKIFEGHRPARTTIAVRQNPLDALVEIECIAEAPD